MLKAGLTLHFRSLSSPEDFWRGGQEHDLRDESPEEGVHRPESKGHGSHQSREKHFGVREASLHRRPGLRLSNRREALPHPRVLVRRRTLYAGRFSIHADGLTDKKCLVMISDSLWKL